VCCFYIIIFAGVTNYGSEERNDIFNRIKALENVHLQNKHSMKYILLSTLALVLLSTQSCTAQQKKQTDRRQTAITDSARWRQDNYIVNRDSAYANPYYGMQKLIGGNRRFQEGRSIFPRQDPALIKRLSEGQSPFATIVGCSDSRVSGEILFDQGFGDLFVSRTAGQVMAQATYGSIEYGYLYLGTKLIVVLGHSSCGAVSAAIKRPEAPPGHIVTLINSIKPAALAAQKEKSTDTLETAVRRNVINQVMELRNLEPVLSRAYDSGTLLIIGAVYDLGTGLVEFLPETMADLPRTAFSRNNITGK
jgi:carbonic anhydrase